MRAPEVSRPPRYICKAWLHFPIETKFIYQQERCDGSPGNCAHQPCPDVPHDWGLVCRHCREQCPTIAAWRAHPIGNHPDGIDIEDFRLYIFFSDRSPTQVREHCRILGARAPDLTFSDVILFEAFCENPGFFITVLRDFMANGTFAQVDMIPGKCFRRTLSDRYPSGLVGGKDPCLVFVLDQAQVPKFKKTDCARLAKSQKLESCQLEVNSAFAPERNLIGAEETESHSPWTVCETLTRYTWVGTDVFLGYDSPPC